MTVQLSSKTKKKNHHHEKMKKYRITAIENIYHDAYNRHEK